jgi:hypothetical protein
MAAVAMNELSSKRYDAALAQSRNNGYAEAPRGSVLFRYNAILG